MTRRNTGLSTQRFDGARVTVLGLGLHGGGIETVRYLHRHGARITVTDLRSEDVLRPSLDAIAGLAEQIVLGRHDESDIAASDFVVKNPAVPRSAPILRHANQIRTDISLFFEHWNGPCIAVTGSKGKSSVSSMIHYALCNFDARARLGGNITLSPLSFADEITEDTPVVLELSSFQLGDLNLVATTGAPVRFSPHIAVITNIFKDHQDYYLGSMDAYVSDKERIFETMAPDGTLVLGSNDSWAARFELRSSCRTVRAVQGDESGNHSGSSDPLEVNRRIACAALSEYGFDEAKTMPYIATFTGIEHRFETVDEQNGVRIINDSAATVPEASLAAARSCGFETVLIAGGTDKRLDVTPFLETAALVRHLVLLSGSATTRIQTLLDESSIHYFGPFESLDESYRCALSRAQDLRIRTILFSPGSASFELFQNEFDRGRQFKKLVAQYRDVLQSRESS